MAEVRLADVIEPRVFDDYVQKRTMEKSDVFASGLIMQDARLSSKLSGGGRTFDMPSWGDLSNSDPDYATDDPANASTPDKLGSFGDVARRHSQGKSWSTMNLASELAGDNAMEAIGNRVSNWWTRAHQRHLISTLTGVFASNVANNGSDLVHDAGAAGISGNVVLAAKDKLGDAADQLQIAVMHSRTHTKLQQQQLITFIPPARGEIGFTTYLDYRVVKDDGMTNDFGTTNVVSTYLAMPGMIAYGIGSPARPVHVEYKPEAGNGSGQEILFTRKEFAMHPRGVKWNDATITGPDGVMPTNADLASAANWTRVYPETKQFPMVELKTTETI